MKVLAVNGSPRKNGNTKAMIDAAGGALTREGITVDSISVVDYEIRPCDACEACYKNAWQCPIEDDALEVLARMRDADGLIVASPVYGAGVTAQLKALLDRSVIAYVNQDLRNKVGGAIAVGGGVHGGQELTIQQIVAEFAFHGMIVANPTMELLGAMGTADGVGEIEKDTAGLQSATELGRRMAELLTR